MRLVKTRGPYRLYELEGKELSCFACHRCGGPPAYKVEGKISFTIYCREHLPKGWKVD